MAASQPTVSVWIAVDDVLRRENRLDGVSCHNTKARLVGPERREGVTTAAVSYNRNPPTIYPSRLKVKPISAEDKKNQKESDKISLVKQN